MLDSIIVLAMHGAPPSDFPRRELGEFFQLPGQMRQADPETRGRLAERHSELDAMLRGWPRTAQNDPYFAGSYELAGHLETATGRRVLVGFFEFCGPSLDEALDQAVESGAERVLVVTPMTTRGGAHSEKDIPDAVHRAELRHPEMTFTYVWPLDPAAVAHLLASQIAQST